MQSTQNTEDNSPAVPPPPLIYSQVVKPKGMLVTLLHGQKLYMYCLIVLSSNLG